MKSMPNTTPNTTPDMDKLLNTKKAELEGLVKQYNATNKNLQEISNNILIKNGELKVLNELLEAKVEK